MSTNLQMVQEDTPLNLFERITEQDNLFSLRVLVGELKISHPMIEYSGDEDELLKDVREGKGSAMYFIGNALYRTYKNEQHKVDAFSMIWQAANHAKYQKAYSLLADMHAYGFGTKIDLAKAYTWKNAALGAVHALTEWCHYPDGSE